MHPFEKTLSVEKHNIEFSLKAFSSISWSEFLLNPRRLRGSDFLMRWSQGVWSEKRLVSAINKTNNYFAIPYGPSGTAPTNDVRAFELYFERLEDAGLGKIKRPDLLLFSSNDKPFVDKYISKIGGLEELPFASEDDLKDLLQKSLLAIECENSLWIAEKMPNFNDKLRPQKRLNGKLGLPKSAVLPTIIIKEEDKKPLEIWQSNNNIPLHIWHVFFDRAYGISFNKLKQLLDEGLIEPTIQVFQAPNGATSKKVIFKVYYHYTYELGISKSKPELHPAYIEDKNGHILPFVKFEGGEIELSSECLAILKDLK